MQYYELSKDVSSTYDVGYIHPAPFWPIFSISQNVDFDK